MRKKRNFLFFEILIFGPLRALFRPFSSIFFFILCKSSVGMPLQLDLLGARSAFYMGRVMLIFSFFFQMRDESKKQYPHIKCTHVELQNMEF